MKIEVLRTPRCTVGTSKYISALYVGIILSRWSSLANLRTQCSERVRNGVLCYLTKLQNRHGLAL